MKGNVLSLCLDYTQKLIDNPLCSEFVNPVYFPNPTLDKEYRQIVKKPMDLSTVRSNLKEREHFKDQEDWANNIRLIFQNAMLFNPPDTFIHGLAKYLLDKFENFYSKMKFLTPASYVQRSTQLYANYLEILSHPPASSSIKIDTPLIENCGPGFEESSLEILMKKLNKISDAQTFNEIQQIIQYRAIDGQDCVVDIGSLSQDTIAKLWEYVRKYEGQQTSNKEESKTTKNEDNN
ncbi:Bromodomain containing protein [Tritrichomonas foetus]|uniref:Bromodomain containing protein n=1 Tax=Tritrichomonas foetus TaxID=1144522 RepID=A0A1J4J5I8_9EUKA|nr:Bromodomain containing protein [Tritrichomonas foetus]|eukprot:OHS93937.1 Bromodomain containing protein [Tritrichomonas foetus]